MSNSSRIIDVNFDRLFEGLKVIEDWARFYLEDKKLLHQIRNLERLTLKTYLKIPWRALLRYRGSKADLGRVDSFDYGRRRNAAEILRANWNRLKSAARSLEEAAKFQAGGFEEFKRIRFRIYDLEKDVLLKFTRRFDPAFYVILDEKFLDSVSLKKIMRSLVNSGVGIVQLRMKTASDLDFYVQAKKIRDLIPQDRMKFVVNDRLDIAMAVGADGVHVGNEDLPLREVRRICEDLIVGKSVKSAGDARQAAREGADYVAVGSIFATTTKDNAEVVGLAALKRIARSVDIPVVAIGGITQKNLKSVFRAGAAGVAMCSAVFKGQIEKNLKELGGAIRKIRSKRS